jgi:hypothetical protein
MYSIFLNIQNTANKGFIEFNLKGRQLTLEFYTIWKDFDVLKLIGFLNLYEILVNRINYFSLMSPFM